MAPGSLVSFQDFFIFAFTFDSLPSISSFKDLSAIVLHVYGCIRGDSTRRSAHGPLLPGAPGACVCVNVKRGEQVEKELGTGSGTADRYGTA